MIQTRLSNRSVCVPRASCETSALRYVGRLAIALDAIPELALELVQVRALQLELSPFNSMEKRC